MAALEVAQRLGVERLIGMVDVEILPMMLDGSGWRVRLLGHPAAYDEGVAQAIEVEVSAAAIAYMGETQALSQDVAFTLDVDAFPSLPPQEVEVLLSLERAPAVLRRTVLALAGRVRELERQGASEAAVQALIEQVSQGLLGTGPGHHPDTS